MGARLGQHFLIDEDAAERIVDASRAREGKRVLEIGPGRGVLTRCLAQRGAAVIAVEMDERLADRVSRELPSVVVIRQDFLKLDLSLLSDPPYVVVANLPYAVGTPILQKILPWHGWSEAVLMFQKEVAERIVAEPGGADYGLLSLSARLYAETETLFTLPRESFSPPPKVSSAVVRLRRRPRPALEDARVEPFFRVARAAFSQRRKMAAGALASGLGLERGRVDAALRRCGVEPGARAERVPFEAWLRLPGELGL